MNSSAQSSDTPNKAFPFRRRKNKRNRKQIPLVQALVAPKEK